tara:strand:- start:439 stop:1314 length:876 start_codon:yes stop_codon:yes gene_type:complete
MKVTQKILLSTVRELLRGKTAKAETLVANLPDRGPCSWHQGFQKIIALSRALESGTFESAPYSIFAKSGNSKLPFVSFSSMAVIDCPGMGACSQWCYSKRAWRYASAALRQAQNSLLLRYPAGRDMIRAEFAKLKTDTVRLYVDGDFPDKETLRFWMDTIRERPDISVYGYSKSWQEFLALHLEGFAWPENYMLNLSGGSRHEGTAFRRAMMALPVTRGEFLAVPVSRDHLKNKAYQSKRNPGFKEYAREVRENAPGKVFVCPGQCGQCMAAAHACGSEKMRGVTIAIGTH